MIGRLGPYIMTLLVFVGLQPAVIYAPNFGALLAFRFITGLFGSPVLATGGASIADMYSPQKRAYGISVWGFAAVLGPVLGPLVGGFAAQAEGWRVGFFLLGSLCSTNYSLTRPSRSGQFGN